MRRLKLGAFALFAAAAVYALTASAAFAYPHYTVTTSAKTPRERNTSTWESTLGSLGGSLTSTELEGETEAINGSEGNEILKFYNTESKITGIKEGKCHTAGEGAGTIKVTGTYHVVEGTNGSGKGNGAALSLIEINPVEITCGSGTHPELTVKGSVLGRLTPQCESTTKYYLEVTGGKGRPTTSKYLTEGGTELEAKLYTEKSSTELASDQNDSGKALLETTSSTELT